MNSDRFQRGPCSPVTDVRPCAGFVKLSHKTDPVYSNGKREKEAERFQMLRVRTHLYCLTTRYVQSGNVGEEREREEFWEEDVVKTGWVT